MPLVTPKKVKVKAKAKPKAEPIQGELPAASAATTETAATTDTAAAAASATASAATEYDQAKEVPSSAVPSSAEAAGVLSPEDAIQRELHRLYGPDGIFPEPFNVSFPIFLHDNICLLLRFFLSVCFFFVCIGRQTS